MLYAGNYLEETKQNIREWMELEDFTFNGQDREEVEERLNDDFWINDSITGNASGSFTFNSYKAQENVLEDIDTLRDACAEFDVDAKTIGEKFLNEEWEWMDVTCRCYVLGQAIAEVLDDLEEEGA